MSATKKEFVVKHGLVAQGPVTLFQDPQNDMEAATRRYVDEKLVAPSVRSVFGRTGDVVMLSSDVVGGLGYTPLNQAPSSADWNARTAGVTSLISGATNGPAGSTAVAGLYLAQTTPGFGLEIAGGEGELYFRSESNAAWSPWRTLLHAGNISGYVPTLTGQGASGTWDISVSGNAATASKLQSGHLINGTNFDGTSDITTVRWGSSRNITIGGTSKAVDGSANVAWTLAEIGAVAATNPIFSNAVKFANGSAAAPSITFSENPTTGLFKKSSGILGVAADGAEVASFSADGALALPGALLLKQATASENSAVNLVWNTADNDRNIRGVRNILTITGGLYTQEVNHAAAHNEVTITAPLTAADGNSPTLYGSINSAVVGTGSGGTAGGYAWLTAVGSFSEAKHNATNPAYGVTDGLIGSWAKSSFWGSGSKVRLIEGARSDLYLSGANSQITTVSGNVIDATVNGTGVSVDTMFLLKSRVVIGASSTVTNRYGIYIDSKDFYNYFGGGVQVGGTGQIAGSTGRKGLGVGTAPPNTEGVIAVSLGVRIGGATIESPLSVRSGVGSGATSANADADEFVIDSNTNAGFSLITSPSGKATIGFGDANNTLAGAIVYNNADDSLSLSVNGATALSISSAGVVTAPAGFSGSLAGNATTASALATPRTINGAAFDGTQDITTSKWGASRNITINGVTQAVDGSSDLSWTIASGAPTQDPAFTGQVRLADGALYTPSICFSSESNLGFYRQSAGAIAFVTGGKTPLIVGSAGVQLSENTGIGTGPASYAGLMMFKSFLGAPTSGVSTGHGTSVMVSSMFTESGNTHTTIGSNTEVSNYTPTTASLSTHKTYAIKARAALSAGSDNATNNVFLAGAHLEASHETYSNAKPYAGLVYGLYSQAKVGGSATSISAKNVYGVFSEAATNSLTNNGTIENAYGVVARVTSAAKTKSEITNSYLFYGDVLVSTGTVTNRYGLYLPDATCYSFAAGGLQIGGTAQTAGSTGLQGLGVGMAPPNATGVIAVSTGIRVGGATIAAAISVKSGPGSGSTGADVGADDLVIDGQGDAGLSLLTNNTGIATIAFGDNNASSVGKIRYDHASDSLTVHTASALALTIANNGLVTAAGGFSGSLAGNATTATTLQTARTINGTSFNGSANITTSKWGASRNITINGVTKAVDGSSDLSWTIEAGGASPNNPVFTGVAKFDDGTAAAPSIAFTSSTNTGLFRKATGVLGLSAAGNEVLFLDSSKNAGFSGRLGVNGATPIEEAALNSTITHTCTGQTVYGIKNAVTLNYPAVTPTLWEETQYGTKTNVDVSGQFSDLVGNSANVVGSEVVVKTNSTCGGYEIFPRLTASKALVEISATDPTYNGFGYVTALVGEIYISGATARTTSAVGVTAYITTSLTSNTYVEEMIGVDSSVMAAGGTVESSFLFRGETFTSSENIGNAFGLFIPDEISYSYVGAGFQIGGQRVDQPGLSGQPGLGVGVRPPGIAGVIAAGTGIRVAGATLGTVGIKSGGGSGAAAADATASNLVIDSDGNAGITILTPSNKYGSLFFGDSGSNASGQIRYTHTTDGFTFYTSNTLALTITSAGLVTAAGGFSGSGASLTSLNAGQLTSGTVPSARLTGTYAISVSGNAATATKFATARNINGVAFDGSADITVTARTPNSLTPGTYLVGSAFNGSAAQTWSVDATSAATESKVVARDASGNFAANIITVAGNGLIINAAAGTTRRIRYQTAGSERWQVGISGNAESGSSVGSDFVIQRYDDSGAAVDLPLTIKRDTGLLLAGVGFSGNGSNLTALNATQLTSGTVPAARLSGTYGISITGNAAKASAVGAYTASDAPGATTLVTRDSNGYSHFSYIESTSPNAENPVISQVIVTNGSEGFFRKASIAYFTTKLTGTAPSLTAGAVSNLGIGFNSVNDLNNLITSGFYRIEASEANRPSAYGQLLVIHGGGDTITQLYGDYISGSLMTRSGNPSSVGGSGSWTGWQTLLSSNNYNSYAPSLTGSGASGTWGISISGNAATANGLSNASYVQAVGRSTSWGISNGTNNGAFNALMGTSSSATWLISGTSGGVFRAGIQALDSDGTLRFYQGSNYFSFGSNILTATTFSGALSGNAATATALQTARTINGTSFDGTTNITTANWGTSCTVTIGSTGKSVNGSADVSWTLAEIGAAPTTSPTFTGTVTAPIFSGSLSGNASTATALATGRAINGTTFDGTAAITTANWGTARTLTIGLTGKSVNGSAAVSWSLAEIGALPLTGGTATGGITATSLGTSATAGTEAATKLYIDSPSGQSALIARFMKAGADVASISAAGLFTGSDFTASSDERLKKNWRDLPEDFIERLAEVRHGVFDRINEDLTQVGVSAQSLQEVLPEAVREGEDGYLSVSYGNAALAAAVQLAKKVVQAEQRASNAESRLLAMEEKMRRIEERMTQLGL